jgi:hypothetical protein
MAAKLTRLSHRIAIQLHLVAQSCTIFSSRSRRPVRKLLDTTSYFCPVYFKIKLTKSRFLSSSLIFKFHLLSTALVNAQKSLIKERSKIAFGSCPIYTVVCRICRQFMTKRTTAIPSIASSDCLLHVPITFENKLNWE